ncbi:D-arabinono-1,4-lactone oxidase-domain-containing protein [Mycena pura]|uniref:D-arabinono-1,4-lactone oxidase n=1 Tax=Mycena pura TaxID=153505 RepID=A0AAD6YLI8_9AGAR|nr:D-arabinono-1,4-lactone oxidase-domain-containing protein [Mycena pura]
MQALSRDQLVAALASSATSRPAWQNWGRTFRCTPAVVFTPTAIHECQLALELARRDCRVLRPVGVGHSPSDIACTTDYMLNMTRMNRVLEVNTTACYVVAEAGILLSDLHAALAPHGLAMRNLGSISDQTLAGIVATATHGCGSTFGVMSTHVLSLTLLLPSNRVVSCSPTENRDLFEASVCGLGATGIILTITLELEPAFNLRDAHSVLPFDQVVHDLDALKSAGEHVRLWWFPAIGQVRCSVMDRTKEPVCRVGSWLYDSVLGFHVVQLLLFLTRFARPLPRPAYPSFSASRSRPTSLLQYLSAFFSYLIALTSHLVSQPLARATRDAHVWAARTALALSGPSQSVTIDRSDRYPQHTTEWAIPARHAAKCLRALAAWLDGERTRELGERPHFPIEVRWSAGDDLWLSPANGGEETCWIGIVQFKPYNLPTRYRAMFAEFERILAAHGGRPHWAKAHHLNARQTRALYPQFERFLKVVEEVDPEGVFRNEYIERHLMSGAGSDGREYKAWRRPLEDSHAAVLPVSERQETIDAKNVAMRAHLESGGRQMWWRRWSWLRDAPSPPDWRIAPPEEELRQRRAQRMTLRGAEDEASDDGSGSASADENESDSDSDATLASSICLPGAEKQIGHENKKTGVDGSTEKATTLIAATF